MGARILIVEDNQANMDLMVYLLTAFGCEAIEAYDGEQGVALARGMLPDLIICDLQLPKLDGYGVMRQLKSDPATRAIPILAASALPVNDHGAALIAAGFDGCMSKGLEPEQLMPTLENYLRRELRPAGCTPAPELEAPPPAAAAPRARILLFDAAPRNGGLIASVLRHFGYALTVAADAPQAADSAALSFDLLVCDLDPAHALRSGFPANALATHGALPLIVLRADASDDVAPLLGGHASPARLLAHPIEPQELLAEIERSLAQARPASAA